MQRSIRTSAFALVALIAFCTGLLAGLQWRDSDDASLRGDLHLLLRQAREIHLNNIHHQQSFVVVDQGAEDLQFAPYKAKAPVINTTDLSLTTIESPADPVVRYEPTHPAADANGYVSYSNVNVAEEQASIASIEAMLGW